MIHRVYVMFELVDQAGTEDRNPTALPNMMASVANGLQKAGHSYLSGYRSRVIKAESIPEPVPVEVPRI